MIVFISLFLASITLRTTGHEDMHMDFEDLQLSIQLALGKWLYSGLEGIDLDRFIIIYLE